jgi:DNA topoisomerase VI subunit A
MQALALPAHAELECRAAISGRIEKLVLSLVLDMVSGVVDGGLDMVQRSSANLIENEHSDALLLGTNVTRRRLGGRSAGPLSRVIAVLSVCHELLLKNKTMSQRELYYLLIKHFQSQRELNVALQDACATLGVPRYALNIGAATRGVLAGTIQIGPAASAGLVDGAMVGSAGWPIPGDLKAVYETCFQSDANYILVIEKVCLAAEWTLRGFLRKFYVTQGD